MFKQMRRQKREIDISNIETILNKGEYGTLATISVDGYPYSLPISYVYYDKSIYFHSAIDGHKIKNIKNIKRYHLV